MHLLQLNEEKWKEETKKRNKREGTKKGFLPDPFSLHDSSYMTLSLLLLLLLRFQNAFSARDFFIVINRNCNNFFMAL